MYFFLRPLKNPATAETHAAIECLSRMYARFIENTCGEVSIVYSEEGEMVGSELVIFKVDDEAVRARLEEEFGVASFTSPSPIMSDRSILFKSFVLIDWFKDAGNAISESSDLEIRDHRYSVDLRRAGFTAKYRSFQASGKTEEKAVENLCLKWNAYSTVCNQYNQLRRSYYIGPVNFIEDSQFNTYTTRVDEVLDGNIDLVKENKYDVSQILL